MYICAGVCEGMAASALNINTFFFIPLLPYFKKATIMQGCKEAPPLRGEVCRENEKERKQESVSCYN